MLAARLSRLDRQLLPDQRTEVMQHSGGKDLAALSAELLTSINPDATVEAASCRLLNLPPNADETTRQDAASTLTAQQLDQVEQDRMRAAL